MIALHDALQTYREALVPMPIERLAPLQAVGRVLAEEVCAAHDLPRYDQSAMDGYALRAADTAAATEERPVILPVTIRLAAGTTERPNLAAATAARILTGALPPIGADCVMPQEIADIRNNALHITAPYPARQNIRHRGEELHQGATIAPSGRTITPQLLAALINAGVAEVAVRRQPSIAVLVSGDEIKPVGSHLEDGEIHNSNGPMVAALLASWNLAPNHIEHLPDDADTTRRRLEMALNEHDLVISTGGASVGDKDFLPATAEALGAHRIFWKVAQKPGKPIFFAVRTRPTHRCAMLALPGNPGAVLIGMLLHVRTALNVMLGLPKPEPTWRYGRLEKPVDRDERRTRLLRMRCRFDTDGGSVLVPLGRQDSHMLSNLGYADVLVEVSPGHEAVAAGTVLPWLALPE